jgi:JAB domain-containing protein similar to deubiquitination enzymes
MWPWSKGRAHRRAVGRCDVFWLSAELLDRTTIVLRQSRAGKVSHEGVAYWAGHRVGDGVLLTTCIAPAAITTRGSFETSARANAQVIAYLGAAKLELVAQIHSHPGDFVGHSDSDDHRALMPYEGFLSIVVPHYGREGMRPLTKCGVHLFERTRFRRLTDDEIDLRFRVADGFKDFRS